MKNDKSRFVSNGYNPDDRGLSGFAAGDRTLYLKLRSSLMKGDDVKFVQKRVGATVDGAFGPQTKAAVTQWQNKNDLPADGRVNTDDWKKLKAQGSGGSSGGGFNWEPWGRSISKALDVLDDEADTDHLWMSDEQYDQSGDIIYKEESGSSNKNLGWWLGGGAVAISLLGIALAAGGNNKK